MYFEIFFFIYIMYMFQGSYDIFFFFEQVKEFFSRYYDYLEMFVLFFVGLVFMDISGVLSDLKIEEINIDIFL